MAGSTRVVFTALRPVFIKTFGCKVNYADSMALGDALRAAGFEPIELHGAELPPEADVLSYAPAILGEPELLVLETAGEWRQRRWPLSVVINTCCVTAEAERKAAQFVRRVRRDYPQARVLLWGCAARNAAARWRYEEAGAEVLATFDEVLARLRGMESVTDETDSHDARGQAPPPARVAPLAVTPVATRGSSADPGPRTPDASAHVPGRARAFIKVQDGCANCCSYCIVPFVRPYASRPLAEVLDEARRRIAEGHRELVLTGINIGHYGMTPVLSRGGAMLRPEPEAERRAMHGIAPTEEGETSLAPTNGGVTPPLPHRREGPARTTAQLYTRVPGHPSLYDLIDELLALLPDGHRLRLSSIEPEGLDPRLFAQLAHPRMCPHLHLPLQSGSDSVLSAMGRGYFRAQYLALVRRFRAACPGGALTTDVMAGFPGETDADFAATLRVCSAAGFERAHCFAFSPRPGTAAAAMPQLPRSVTLPRNRRLIAHCRAVAEARWQRFCGTAAQLLVEEVRADEGGRVQLSGYGEAYQVIQVTLPDATESQSRQLIGRILPVRLVGLRDCVFAGRLL